MGGSSSGKGSASGTNTGKNAGNRETGENDAANVTAKGKYRAPREKTKLTFNEQKEYDNIEAEIEKLEARSAELEKLIAGASTDYSKLMELSKEKEETDALIESRMERFIELQDMVEKFSGN